MNTPITADEIRELRQLHAEANDPDASDDAVAKALGELADLLTWDDKGPGGLLPRMLDEIERRQS